MDKIRYSLFLLAFLPISTVSAAGATLYVAPASGVYQLGEPFEVQILANTAGQPITAAEGELAYNPGNFAVDTISVERSVLTSWSTPPSYDGSAGIIKFSGWAEHPYTGNDGLLVTITFRALRVSQGTLRFNSGAMLAADGRGNNILTSMSSGSYSVSPKQNAPPVAPGATSSLPDVFAPTSQEQDAPQNPAAVSVAARSDQVASLISSGAELAPVLAAFFLALTLIAFGIAYVLHRNGVR